MQMIYTGKSVDQVKYEYSVDGFSVLSPDYDLIAPLISSFQRRFVYMAGLSMDQAYKALIIKNADLQNEVNSDFREYKRICQLIIRDIGLKEKNMDAIFCTLDSNRSSHIAQVPHFDRIPTLKFMLYVNDIHQDSGSLWVSPGSQSWSVKRADLKHRSFNDPAYLKDSRNIPSYIKDRLIPIELKSGNIIMFNTNCIHHQGIVQKGVAKIVRSHFRH